MWPALAFRTLALAFQPPATPAEVPGLAWSIGIALPILMLLVACVAILRGHKHRWPLMLAAILAGGWMLGVWLILRRVMRSAGTFEIVFLQLSMASVATFFFVVIAMIAAWRQNRARSRIAA